jgi:hypothetical protein
MSIRFPPSVPNFQGATSILRCTLAGTNLHHFAHLGLFLIGQQNATSGFFFGIADFHQDAIAQRLYSYLP